MCVCAYIWKVGWNTNSFQMSMNGFISFLCMWSIKKKNKLGNAGFWESITAWRALLPAASGSLGLGYSRHFSLLTRGDLKGVALLPNAIFYESKKYCDYIQNTARSLFKCQCRWENTPFISDIWFMCLNNCAKYTYSFFLNGKSSAVTED